METKYNVGDKVRFHLDWKEGVQESEVKEIEVTYRVDDLYLEDDDILGTAPRFELGQKVRSRTGEEFRIRAVMGADFEGTAYATPMYCVVGRLGQWEEKDLNAV